eukprot:scaffold5629_cov17-Tisochrysis_lutea.AAC.1
MGGEFKGEQDRNHIVCIGALEEGFKGRGEFHGPGPKIDVMSTDCAEAQCGRALACKRAACLLQPFYYSFGLGLRFTSVQFAPESAIHPPFRALVVNCALDVRV